MRPGTDALKQVLEGSFTRRLFADAFSGAERTLKDLAVTRWDLQWSREARLKSGGGIDIVYPSQAGESISPKKIGDPLAPYGQEVALALEVSAGEFTERVELGSFRIGAAPRGRDQFADFRGRQIVTASEVSLDLEDRLAFVDDRGFRSEEHPASTSAWQELARITDMPILQSLPDVVLPTTLVYQARRGGRLNAVKTIADLIGGTEFVTSDGALSVLPYTAGTAVGTLRLGPLGTITGDDDGLDPRDVFNVVVGDYKTAAGVPFQVVQAATGDLSPEVIPERTYFHSNEAITTLGPAEADVAKVLGEVSRPAKRIKVQCLLNPLAEVGDVWHVERRDGTTLTARIASIGFGDSDLMTVEMDTVTVT